MNMFVKGRKGFVTVLFIIAITSFIMFGFTLYLLLEHTDDIDLIGQTQLRLLHTKEIEKDVSFYLDRSIGVSISDAQNVVSSDNFGCDVMVYPVVGGCELDEGEVFEEAFERSFRKHLAKYPLPFLRQSSFDFSFDDLSVRVRSVSDIGIPVYGDSLDYRVSNFPFSAEDSFVNQDGFTQFFGFYGGARVSQPETIILFDAGDLESIEAYMNKYDEGVGVEVYNYLIVDDKVYSLLGLDSVANNIRCGFSNIEDCESIIRRSVSVGIASSSGRSEDKIKDIVNVLERSFTAFNPSQDNAFIEANDFNSSFSVPSIRADNLRGVFS